MHCRRAYSNYHSGTQQNHGGKQQYSSRSHLYHQVRRISVLQTKTSFSEPIFRRIAYSTCTALPDLAFFSAWSLPFLWPRRAVPLRRRLHRASTPSHSSPPPARTHLPSRRSRQASYSYWSSKAASQKPSPPVAAKPSAHGLPTTPSLSIMVVQPCSATPPSPPRLNGIPKIISSPGLLRERKWDRPTIWVSLGSITKAAPKIKMGNQSTEPHVTLE